LNATSLIQQPFIQVALPILIGFFLTVIVQNKRFEDLNRRFDDMNRRLDEIIKRLDRIESKLDDHERRLTRVEERTSPLRA
jgi:low affinity Fe/Cu permease